MSWSHHYDPGWGFFGFSVMFRPPLGIIPSFITNFQLPDVFHRGGGIWPIFKWKGSSKFLLKPNFYMLWRSVLQKFFRPIFKWKGPLKWLIKSKCNMLWRSFLQFFGPFSNIKGSLKWLFKSNFNILWRSFLQNFFGRFSNIKGS